MYLCTDTAVVELSPVSSQVLTVAGTSSTFVAKSEITLTARYPQGIDLLKKKSVPYLSFDFGHATDHLTLAI